MKKCFKLLAATALSAAMLSGCANQAQVETKETPAPQTEKQTEAPAAAASEEKKTEAEKKPEAESGAAAKTEYEPVHLRVAYMPNMGSASAIIAARDGGYFDKVGITVDLVQFQGGPAEIAAMA